MTITSIPNHKTFLKQLNYQIDQNIGNEEFSINQLCLFLGMSRSQLYRTLRATNGMSVARYIRKRQLKKAEFLLIKKQNWNICQIAMETGFYDHAHFTHWFKKTHQCSPFEYRTQNRSPLTKYKKNT